MKSRSPVRKTTMRSRRRPRRFGQRLCSQASDKLDYPGGHSASSSDKGARKAGAHKAITASPASNDMSDAGDEAGGPKSD